jgi:hypothetical protein
MLRGAIWKPANFGEFGVWCRRPAEVSVPSLLLITNLGEWCDGNFAVAAPFGSASRTGHVHHSDGRRGIVSVPQTKFLARFGRRIRCCACAPFSTCIAAARADQILHMWSFRSLGSRSETCFASQLMAQRRQLGLG